MGTTEQLVGAGPRTKRRGRSWSHSLCYRSDLIGHAVHRLLQRSEANLSNRACANFLLWQVPRGHIEDDWLGANRSQSLGLSELRPELR